MGRFILRRIALALVTLWLLSVIVFVATEVMPGDVARSILGPTAAPETVEALNEELGTDQPVLVRYGDWVAGIFQGDLGESYAFRRPVDEMIGPALWNSAKLAFLAFLLVVPLGILGGVTAALYEGRAADRSDLRGWPLGLGNPRLRLGGGHDPRLRHLARRAPRDGAGAAGSRLSDAGRVPDPARPLPRLRPLRLPGAHGAGGDRGSAGFGLHADGGPQGAAATNRDPPARPPELPPADDRRRRDPDRIPDRRPGCDRADLQLPGHRTADSSARPTRRTSRCSRAPCS